MVKKGVLSRRVGGCGFRYVKSNGIERGYVGFLKRIGGMFYIIFPMGQLYRFRPIECLIALTLSFSRSVYIFLSLSMRI